MVKPALQMEPAFKSRLEKKGADQFSAAGVEYGYEQEIVRFNIPAREAKYNPDFGAPKGIEWLTYDGRKMLIEFKGRFGHRGSNGAEIRKRLALVKEQHPELDIRIVFQNANLPIYKGSPTTYQQWADDHGFLWADKGIVPPEWIVEIKTNARKADVSDGSKPSKHRPRAASNAASKKGARAS